nr:MAG TPA: DNA binding protein [Caudoviricetes sp.]
MNKMSYADFVRLIAERSGQSQNVVKEVLKGFSSALLTAAKEGESVSIPQLGKFAPRQRTARKGFNPLTKQAIEIPASVALSFKESAYVKEELNA